MARSKISKNPKTPLLQTLTSLPFFLLAGLLLRFIFIYPQYSGDIRNHLAWADSALTSLSQFYFHTPAGFADPNYPPLTIYLFTFFRWLYFASTSLVNYLNATVAIFPSRLVHLMPTLNMQAAFLKLPSIFADLGVAYLIFKLARLQKLKFPKLLASFYLFNPAVFYISSTWGQIESLPIFFLLLSLYFSLRKNSNPYLSHLSFLLAILSKQTALWLAPVFLILWLHQSDLKTTLKGLLLQLIIFILAFLPFTSFSLIQPFQLYLATLSGSSIVIADAAFNLYSFFFNPSLPDSTLFLGLSIRLWSILLLAITYALVCFRLYRHFSFSNLFLSLALLSLAAFFLQTRVHERHLAPALPFLLLTSLNFNRKTLLYLLLSAFHFYNLTQSLGLPMI